MNGLHLIGDLHACACDAGLLTDPARLEAICLTACRDAGLTPVGKVVHAFVDGQGTAAGVTCAIVLAESHLCLHTWPEASSVTLDLYVCNFSADNRLRARAAYSTLVGHLQPTHELMQEIERGVLPTRPVIERAA